MKDSVSITVPSHPKYLSVVREATVKIGALYGFSNAEAEHIKLAVDEACSNIIKHAYKGASDQRIDVRFRITKRGLEVIIEDDGIKAQPEVVEGRSLYDIKPGGLGVHFIKRAFDVVAFDTKRKKGNRLILIKYRKKEKR